MVDIKNEILFGIVTYKERYWECASFISLIKSFSYNSNSKRLNIVIYDNTDLIGWQAPMKILPKNINLEYFHDISNSGISIAYNFIHKIAVQRKYSWIVFLDQDTMLPIESFSIYTNYIDENKCLPIAVPIIYFGKRILSPSRYIFYRSFLFKKIDTDIINLKYASCINSGLLIMTAFYTINGGYNTNLKLDFCDHDFIEKIKEVSPKLQILNIKLKQNLSSFTNTKEKAISRYKIYLKDYLSFSKTRNKPILLVFLDLPHLLNLTIKYKSLSFLKLRLNLK